MGTLNIFENRDQTCYTFTNDQHDVSLVNLVSTKFCYTVFCILYGKIK